MGALQLQRDVVEELEYEPSVNAAHVGVSAEAGIVTLSGHVGSYVEKLAAIAAARRVKGVKAIADEIAVRYATDKKAADNEIAQRAVGILGWDTLVPSGSIQITVRDGWITLSGTVDWFYQCKAAEEDVRKLSGVHGIVNNIEIRPHARADDVKKKIEGALKRHAEVEAEAIRITVHDNDRVLLEGKVDNWNERHAVENAAWSAAGVRSVDDRITVG
ncbi:MAG TPA: BON domain-containing protein [Xanthobacteraceae bacterium]|nr:BON domain-containing protein [Xanthobacteraceae bacterium]